VFIQNIPTTLSDDDIKEEMEKIGSVLSVHSLKDKTDRTKSVGKAFVNFEEESSRDAALKLDGTELFGETVNISPPRPSEGKTRGGSRGRGGFRGGRGRGGDRN